MHLTNDPQFLLDEHRRRAAAGVRKAQQLASICRTERTWRAENRTAARAAAVVLAGSVTRRVASPIAGRVAALARRTTSALPLPPATTGTVLNNLCGPETPLAICSPIGADRAGSCTG